MTMKKLLFREMSLIIFIDKNQNIIGQIRGKHSRVGEKYGFWGGGRQGNETKKETLERELKEELGYIPEKYKYWTSYKATMKEKPCEGLKVLCHIFVSPITKKLMESKTKEGDGLIKISLDKAIKEDGFHWADVKLLKKMKRDWSKVWKIVAYL